MLSKIVDQEIAKRWVDSTIGALILSGVLHIPLFLIGSREWEDPLSFRKAILFGISTGLTLWSCERVFQALKPLRSDKLERLILASSLLGEVFLITLQTWRGERSHFNLQSSFGVSIETAMLALISIAVIVIAKLMIRCFFLDAWKDTCEETSSRRIAITGGLVFLLISCSIGYAITLIGHWLQNQGRAPEIFGQRGVLKFPHGIALHAIQIFELLALASQRLGHRVSVVIVIAAIVIQSLAFVYACQQTALGRGRWETPLPQYWSSTYYKSLLAPNSFGPEVPE